MHVEDESQLFREDVCGEEENVDTAAEPGGALARSKTFTAAGTGKEAPLGGVPRASSQATLEKPRRKKRNAERASSILFWLESKYDVLPKVLSSREGWKEFNQSGSDFDLLWSDTAITAERFMKLKLYQKMNHFVGMSSITRKNNLGRNLLRMRKQFPKEYKFFPDTWILPTDLTDFKSQFSAQKNKTFIIKPDNGCQGKGIFLVRDAEKVPVDFSQTYVAQRYLHRPYLLDGYKFDLRLYVLVMGCDPLRILLHRRGLVRLASEPYVEPSAKNLSQTMVHLTNYAINKGNPNFEENTNPDDGGDGHKRSWEAVSDLLRSEGHDIEALNADIEDLIVKTLIAVQPSLSHFYRSCQPDDVENAMCFEVLGFDVMLDYKLQPWLLEVNHAPSFATESELDRLVKEEVLNDTFTLLDLTPEARQRKKREAKERLEQRAKGTGKKSSLDDRILQEQDLAMKRQIWEDANLNGYKRLYPSEEKEWQYMQVHDAAISIWEMLMGGTCRRSIRLTNWTQQPPDERLQKGDDEEVERERSKSKPKVKELPAPVPKYRSPEELNQIMERLMAGCAASPRHQSKKTPWKSSSSSAAAVGKTQSQGTQDDGADGDDPDHPVEDCSSSLPSATGSTNRPTKSTRSGVQIGDVIKVQTNIGWELVTVRVKRTNGKLDIQFKDGEYMRSVMPRILRDSAGEATINEAVDMASVRLASVPNSPAASPQGAMLRPGGPSRPPRPAAAGGERGLEGAGCADEDGKHPYRIHKGPQSSGSGNLQSVFGAGSAVIMSHLRHRNMNMAGLTPFPQQVRFPQQLQQVISVRPIAVPRSRSTGPTELKRRHTLGDK